MDKRKNPYEVSHRDEAYFYTLFRDFFEKDGAKTEYYNQGKNQGKEADFRVTFDGEEKKIELKTNDKQDCVANGDPSFDIEYQQRSDKNYKIYYRRNNNAGWRYYCDADEIWFWLYNDYRIIRVDWKKLKRDLDSDDMKKGIVKPEYTPVILGGGGKVRINADSLIPKKPDAGNIPWIEKKMPDWDCHDIYIMGRKFTLEMMKPYIIGELYIDYDENLTLDKPKEYTF